MEVHRSITFCLRTSITAGGMRAFVLLWVITSLICNFSQSLETDHFRNDWARGVPEQLEASAHPTVSDPPPALHRSDRAKFLQNIKPGSNAEPSFVDLSGTPTPYDVWVSGSPHAKTFSFKFTDKSVHADLRVIGGIKEVFEHLEFTVKMLKGGTELTDKIINMYNPEERSSAAGQQLLEKYKEVQHFMVLVNSRTITPVLHFLADIENSLKYVPGFVFQVIATFTASGSIKPKEQTVIKLQNFEESLRTLLTPLRDTANEQAIAAERLLQTDNEEAAKVQLQALSNLSLKYQAHLQKLAGLLKAAKPYIERINQKHNDLKKGFATKLWMMRTAFSFL